MPEPIMNIRQRALQFWSVLALAAHNQNVLSYSMLSKLTGYATESGSVLGYIAFYCMKHQLPILTVLVVNEETGKPSAKFYDYVDVASEQRRCFVFNWMEHPIPTLEQLDEAHGERDKLEEQFKKPVKAATA